MKARVKDALAQRQIKNGSLPFICGTLSAPIVFLDVTDTIYFYLLFLRSRRTSFSPCYKLFIVEYNKASLYRLNKLEQNK